VHRTSHAEDVGKAIQARRPPYCEESQAFHPARSREALIVNCSHARAFSIAILTTMLTGCSTRPHAVVPAVQSQRALPPIPSGEVGKLVLYGRDILSHTARYAGKNVKADMSCTSCHLQNGTKARALSLVGVYSRFPQYNIRAGRVISLEDRIAECFLYSMNGTPPAYTSREMESIVAYLAYLSAGSVLGSAPDATLIGREIAAPSVPKPSRGKAIYAQNCSACHQSDGRGISGSFPPLWGSKSFNDGAGMHRISRMATFVKYNMPLGAPNSLNAQEAYDVAAYVLAHPRPAFDKNRRISWPPVRADYF
jgi:thiosulfate dehydrogenase